jgi:Glycogen recognition site of AMP-activated protein kinase
VHGAFAAVKPGETRACGAGNTVIPGTATEGPRKIITMDLNNARRLGKQPYQAVREQFDQLGERVIERHWDPGAPVRQGYRRFLGALDELAGKLLDDDEIARRGQDLLRETGADGTAGAEAPDEAAGTDEATGADGATGADEAIGTDRATGAGGAEEAAVTDAEAAGAGGAGASQETAADQTSVTADETPAGESVWTQASDEVDRTGEAEVGEAWAAGNARVAAEGGETGEAPSTPTVDVVFSLPAETEAGQVALCGEFNDWSPETTSLTRGDDRAWRVTVPLAPGTYRYKFLLDGETWENGTDADRYEENAYGTTDSVVVVSQ